MSREWKPGDVAMRIGRFGSMVALYVEGCAHDHAGTSDWRARPHWHYQNGGWSPSETETPHRPLVVIDAEDREQVALILSHYHSWKWTDEIAGASIADMQAALREFANPTPPTCKAAVNLAGEPFGCVEPEGHGGGHRNPDAEAVWGEPE